MKRGDLVRWVPTKDHDYYDYSRSRIGILLEQHEVYDKWICVEILDQNGDQRLVMIEREGNPLQMYCKNP